MGNLFSSEECPEVAAEATEPVYKACENAGEYYNGTSCVSFPSAPEATFDLKKLVLNNEDYTSLKGGLDACGPDISYFDNSQMEGSKCGTCGDNEIFDGTGCACNEGYRRTGENCVIDCSEVGQMRNDDGTACICQPGYNEFPMPGGKINCSLESFSNRQSRDSVARGRTPVMLLLVLVLLYIYRRQVQVFLKKTVKKI